MSLHWRYELWWGIIFRCIYLHPMLLSFPKTADSLFLCLQAFNWDITFPFSLVISLSLLRHICIWLKFYYLWFSCLLFFFFSYEYLVIKDKIHEFFWSNFFHRWCAIFPSASSLMNEMIPSLFLYTFKVVVWNFLQLDVYM